MSGFLDLDVSTGSSVTILHHIVESTRASNSTLQCNRLEPNYTQLVEFFLSVGVLPFHFFVLVAMIIHKDVVKRNMVNLYAGNVFVANTFMASWRILVNAGLLYDYDKTYFYPIINGTVEHEKDGMFLWWTFKKQFALVLLLVTSGSIGLVINVMRSSMFRVHRTVAGLTLRQSFGPSDEKRGEASKVSPSCMKRIRRIVRRHPKVYAACLLVLVWIFPVILAVSVIGRGTCDMTCQCLFDTFPVGDHGKCDINKNCSDIYPPASRIFIGMGTALILIYMSSMAVMLCKTYLDFRKVVRQRLAEASVAKSEDDNELKSMKDSEDQNKNSIEKQNDDQTTPPSDEPGPPEIKVQIKSNQGSQSAGKTGVGRKSDRKKSIPGSIFLHSGRTHLRLLFFIYGAFVVGVVPIALYALIDAFKDAEGAHPRHMSSTMIPLVAMPILTEFFCTIMLCVHLSGVKSATRLLLVSLVSCATR